MAVVAAVLMVKFMMMYECERKEGIRMKVLMMTVVVPKIKAEKKKVKVRRGRKLKNCQN